MKYIDQGGVIKAQGCSDLNTIDRGGDDQIITNGGQQDELDKLTVASHKTSHGGLLRQQIKGKTVEGDEDDQRTILIRR